MEMVGYLLFRTTKKRNILELTIYPRLFPKIRCWCNLILSIYTVLIKMHKRMAVRTVIFFVFLWTLQSLSTMSISFIIIGNHKTHTLKCCKVLYTSKIRKIFPKCKPYPAAAPLGRTHTNIKPLHNALQSTEYTLTSNYTTNGIQAQNKPFLL